MSNITAVPSHDLVKEGQGSSTFFLFGESWLHMQSYISQAMKLPINSGDFTQKYGDFSKKAMIDSVLGAMTDVQNLSVDFGNPSLVKQNIISNPNYLTSGQAPHEIYSHIIWLANQIYNQATTFQMSLDPTNLRALLADMPPAERGQSVRMLFTGEGGLTTTANEMKEKTQALLSKLLIFDGKFTAANTKMSQYTAGQGEMMTELSTLIGTLSTQIKNTRDSADDAYDKWIALTAAAVATSVGIAVVSGGLLLPLAAAAGAGLGYAAYNARENYNDLMDTLHKTEAKKKLKVNLQVDLQGLNGQLTKVAPAMGEFHTNLGKVEGVWNDVSMNLTHLVTEYSDEKLGDLNWMATYMKLPAAVGKWGKIATSCQQFTSNSMVDFDNSVDFGNKIENAAA